MMTMTMASRWRPGQHGDRERTEYRGTNISMRDDLRAANRTNSGVASMPVVGTALLQLILPLVDQGFRAWFRVVEGPT